MAVALLVHRLVNPSIFLEPIGLILEGVSEPPPLLSISEIVNKKVLQWLGVLHPLYYTHSAGGGVT